VIGDQAAKAMTLINGIDTCKQTEPGFWKGMFTRAVVELDQAGNSDGLRVMRELLWELWERLDDKAEPAPPGKCDRCGEPAANPARTICGECDDVLLCDSCYLGHARTVVADGREQDAILDRPALERFRAAADVLVRAAERELLLKTVPSLADFDPATGRSGADDWMKD
jgi:hypothetical protein